MSVEPRPFAAKCAQALLQSGGEGDVEEAASGPSHSNCSHEESPPTTASNLRGQCTILLRAR
eukprot:7718755-Prorocentrum_lima.AAC.1